eukprot:6204298-Pleurochrysis_carterae.AAC.2
MNTQAEFLFALPVIYFARTDVRRSLPSFLDSKECLRNRSAAAGTRLQGYLVMIWKQDARVGRELNRKRRQARTKA